MKTISVTKVFNLNENYRFPNCKLCNNELTPFSITEEELNKLDFFIKKTFIEAEIVKLNEISQGKHLIYLCKYCLDWSQIQC